MLWLLIEALGTAFDLPKDALQDALNALKDALDTSNSNNRRLRDVARETAFILVFVRWLNRSSKSYSKNVGKKKAQC